MHSRNYFGLFASALTGLANGAMHAQDYPHKPVRIVASGTGGGGDFASRVIAQGLTSNLGQQVVVEHRGGGIGAAEVVARAQPDGYTLMFYGSTIWVSPFMRSNLPYDPVRDFAPVTLAIRSPNVLAVNPSVAAKSVKQLIALVKSKPGELNYAARASGSTPHLAAELFKSMAGVEVVRIPYKSNGAAYTDLLSGQVQLMFATTGGATPHIQSGKLRALAVTGAQPSPLVPGLPTVSAAGLPGYESVSMSGVFVPAKTPRLLINRISSEIIKVLNSADVKERLFGSGVEVAAILPLALRERVRVRVRN